MKIGGIHALLDFVDCEENINDEGFIHNLLNQIAYFCELDIIDTKSHKFESQGVTAMALLSESHISIHTWPEEKFLSCDIYSSSEKEVKYIQLKEMLAKNLKGQCTMQLLRREKGKINLISEE